MKLASIIAGASISILLTNAAFASDLLLSKENSKLSVSINKMMEELKTYDNNKDYLEDLLNTLSPIEKPAALDYIALWSSLCTELREKHTPKDVLKSKFLNIMPELKKYILDKYGPQKFLKTDTYFPVLNYEITNIGGENGSGFNIRGFNLFDGTKRTAHPAHDIFVYDRNNDSIDDKTKKPFVAIAMQNSVVLSIYDEWKYPSELRGGNYVWLYNPLNNILYYYAHLDKIYVKAGQLLTVGEAIGTVGRTGKYAYEERSPTHLHLMLLEVENDDMKPINFYSSLKRAKVTKKEVGWANNVAVLNLTRIVKRNNIN